jgi:hypothetical protein
MGTFESIEQFVLQENEYILYDFLLETGTIKSLVLDDLEIQLNSIFGED